MATVVPLTEAMRERAALLFASAHPHRTNELDGRAMQCAAVDGEHVVGFAAAWQAQGARRVEIVVAPAHRRRGIGDALLAEAARGDEPVEVRPAAADADSIAFAARRGFVETERVHHLVLAVADATHDDQRGVFDRLARAGIAIVTLADFTARRKDAHAAFADLVAAVREGEVAPPPDDPLAIVAEQRGRLLGVTSARGTGVRPESRGLGIATALEIAAIDAAIGRGETTLRRAASDPAMRHIDAKLGFRETACDVRMVRGQARP